MKSVETAAHVAASVHGAPVGQWQNVSGNARHVANATAGQRPTLDCLEKLNMAASSTGTQTTGQIGIDHGVFLFRRVAQATAAVGLHNGSIHSCHRSKNYDAYELGRGNDLCKALQTPLTHEVFQRRQQERAKAPALAVGQHQPIPGPTSNALRQPGFDSEEVLQPAQGNRYSVFKHPYHRLFKHITRPDDMTSRKLKQF